MANPFQIKRAAGSGSSLTVDCCQVCGSEDLQSVIFIGYLPPVNQMWKVGQRPHEQPAYPAEVLRCPRCELVQLGLIVDPNILFPPDYPYTSGTTKLLRDNFAELYREFTSLFPLSPQDLVIDIGSNDGTLLGNFHQAGQRVLGIEPTDNAKLAIERGIASEQVFFGREVAQQVCARHGSAALITAANVFAHMEDIHSVLDGILCLLAPNGIFVSESHYLVSLLATLQYDTIYHEHLRYYSLHSLRNLLAMHGLEVIHARRIPTHGGSIRVYADRQGAYPVRSSVNSMLAEEKQAGIAPASLADFKRRVALSKLELHGLLRDIKRRGEHIFGIGAPSRASTLVNYVGIDDGIMECVCEVQGSYKIGKYMPGTLIPVVEESRLYEEQPGYALLLSWHIADELIPKIAARGFRGDFLIPLPAPRIVPAARASGA